MPASKYVAYRLWVLALLVALLAGCAGREMPLPEPRTGERQGISIERAMILANARQAIGIPYRYGGNTPSGLDCSGLVQMAYGAAGIAVPRTADQQYRQLPERDHIAPGDLLFFGSGSKATHVGIYLGERRMVHAPGSGRHVTVTSLELDYWQERYLGAAGPRP